MIKFKGRSCLKVYIKNKPTKWGFKLYNLCESTSGYCLNIIPYAGKVTELTHISITENIVVSILEKYL